MLICLLAAFSAVAEVRAQSLSGLDDLTLDYSIDFSGGTGASIHCFDIEDATNRMLILQESTDNVIWQDVGSFKVTNTDAFVEYHGVFPQHPHVFYRIKDDPVAQIPNTEEAVLDLPETPFEYANIPLPAHLTNNQELNDDNTPVTNPITNAGARLGRVLFYDKRLSINGQISCASCHHQDKGFTDGRQFSVGFEGGLTGRNSMGLAMARFYRGPANGAFFWDERAPTLEDQTTQPIQDALEMGSTFPDVAIEIAAEPFYQTLFAAAFPADPTINEANIQLALAQFVRSMVSHDSKYDQVQKGLDTFTVQEQQGLDLFQNVANDATRIVCSACHTTDNFVGVGPRNIGLDLVTVDPGAGNGNFKIGSLRNVELTGPYMHDGRFDTLEEVIDHYSTGIQAHPNLHPRLRVDGTLGGMGGGMAMGAPVQPNYTQAEKDALVAFLRTLTDTNFTTDPRWSDPFNYTGVPGVTTPNFTATFLISPALPLQGEITEIRVGTALATIFTYDQGTGVVELLFDGSGLAPGHYNAVIDYTPSGGSQTFVFSTNQFVVPGVATPTFATTFPTSPALPLLNEITSVTVGGVVATILSYDQMTGAIGLSFDPSSLAAGNHDVVLTYGGGTMVTASDQYVVSPPATDPNILFMILDDWAIDMSPVDNTVPPGAVLPNMPNLQGLATGGLRFTRGYVTPVCSPTRAAIMTGRHAHQTGVYAPGGGDNVLPDAELALPEAFTAAGSSYSMASMGKWHLANGTGGSNDDGWSDTGGWDEFYGITGGGVGDYFSWNKNSNGTVANSTTYTTTDQVNEALAFIGREETAGNPWLCWVAFNAPHSPFHDPPAGLAPPGGYTTGTANNTDLYIRMLEALDTELGRLLGGIPADTNIILVGDNGTPNQVVQAPFGNGHSKGDIYDGGTHVTWIVNGPAVTVPAGSTTDKLVKAIDLYATMLELAGIDPASVPGMPATTLAQSTSIVPILNGTDTADRVMIVEGGNAGPNRGRAIITDDFPDYKLLIFNDPENPGTANLEFYNITTDVNEQSPLYNGPFTATPGLTGTELDAWNACIAADAALGGGYLAP
ncbi:MAG: cytochrome c peroxidase [Verrucomicrobiota bacterium]